MTIPWANSPDRRSPIPNEKTITEYIEEGS
jgi:hypothetical protein